MLDLSIFTRRAQEAAKEIAEAVGSSGAPAQPPGAPGRPPGPLSPPQGPLAAAQLPGPSGGPPGGLPGGLAVQPPGKVTPTSPLQMMPVFKSPMFASMLQGEVGRQGPVGFAQGGRVQRDLAVGGPAYDFSCR